ncbi:MAG: hypothetical protein ABSG15_01485 [FCB group bacterium]|jgi:hypothetical protein
MASSAYSQKSYFELSEHNNTQVAIFIILTILLFVFSFWLFLPVLKYFFISFLNGQVYNETGKFLPYSPDSLEPKNGVSYLFSWAVDIYKNKAVENRYWFDPVVTIFLQVTMLSLCISIIITSLLPEKLGYMRQKIEREIINTIERITQNLSISKSSSDNDSFMEEIIYWDIRKIQEYAEELNMTFEDLKTLQKAVKWKYGSMVYRLFHINDGLRMYMRFYFTIHYNNTILGFVYIGAAILIIIIGMRGLKFIPPTQPSAVLFALSLEFSLLITYAVTLMYSRQEEEQPNEKITGKQSDAILLTKDFGSSRDIENLLRVFINKRRN